jgi:Zn-dependent peptidase ImmA (M78 family)
LRDPKIAKRAEEFLDFANVSKPPVPVLEIAKKAGVTVRFGALPDELSGFLMHDKGKVILGVNSLHSPRRQAFTIAHELGHYALHPKANFVDHKILYFRDARSAPAADKQEVEANQFAAALLMPASFLAKLLKNETVDLEDEERIEEVAKKLGVSTQALTFRLVNLNLARSNLSQSS